MNQNKLLSQHIWEPCERSQGHHTLHVLCNGNSRRMVKPKCQIQEGWVEWMQCRNFQGPFGQQAHPTPWIQLKLLMKSIIKFNFNRNEKDHSLAQTCEELKCPNVALNLKMEWCDIDRVLHAHICTSSMAL